MKRNCSQAFFPGTEVPVVLVRYQDLASAGFFLASSFIFQSSRFTLPKGKNTLAGHRHKQRELFVLTTIKLFPFVLYNFELDFCLVF